MSLLWHRVAAYDPNHPDNRSPEKDQEDEPHDHPTDWGYHCGTECWDDVERKVGYQSPEYARGAHSPGYGGIDWASKPVEKHPMPSELHAEQDHIHPAVVAHYAAGGGPGTKENGEAPSILKWRGKHFAHQGTHRLAAAMQRGDTHYEGKFHDLDEEMGR